MRMTMLPVLVLVTMPLLAQTPSRRIVRFPPNRQADFAETAIKQAMDQFANEKKIFERDISVLQHLHAADDALGDTMQPNNAIEKAFEEVQAAYRLDPEFVVKQGVLSASHELEDARRSPATADFGRLRTTIRHDALVPAASVAARNGTALQESVLSWIKVQELISSHLRALSETAADSLRAVQQ